MGKIIVLEGSHCSGKSTAIEYIKNNLNFNVSKSVPNWFREFIPYARSQNSEVQGKIYEIGHMAVYNEAINSKNNYVFDRWQYTTYIRLCYNEMDSIDQTVEKIEKIASRPDMVLIIRSSIDNILKRMIERDKFIHFDENFYRFENEVFNILANNDEIFKIIDNNGSTEEFYFTLDECFDAKKQIERKRKYENIK